jgi:DNA-binding transcriptional ArsR family regulator
MSDTELTQMSTLALERAAELFGVLSTPMRLKIIGALCGGEQNVSRLLSQIEASQPNMSRHLQVLYQAGVLSKRRAGQQVFYKIADHSVVNVCKVVCVQDEAGRATGAANLF